LEILIYAQYMEPEQDVQDFLKNHDWRTQRPHPCILLPVFRRRRRPGEALFPLRPVLDSEEAAVRVLRCPGRAGEGGGSPLLTDSSQGRISVPPPLLDPLGVRRRGGSPRWKSIPQRALAKTSHPPLPPVVHQRYPPPDAHDGPDPLFSHTHPPAVPRLSAPSRRPGGSGRSPCRCPGCCSTGSPPPPTSAPSATSSARHPPSRCGGRKLRSGTAEPPPTAST